MEGELVLTLRIQPLPHHFITCSLELPVTIPKSMFERELDYFGVAIEEDSITVLRRKRTKAIRVRIPSIFLYVSKIELAEIKTRIKKIKKTPR